MVTLCCNDFLDSFEKLYKYQKQWAEFKKTFISDYDNVPRVELKLGKTLKREKLEIVQSLW